MQRALLLTLALAGAAAAANLGPAIAAGLAQCGPKCARAGLGAPSDASLTVAPWSYDSEYNLILTWNMSASSLARTEGYNFSGNVYAITGNLTSYSLELITPLFVLSTYDDNGEPILDAKGGVIPTVRSFAAAEGRVTLDWMQTYPLDILSAYPDNVLIELILQDASGAAVNGHTVYSPLFAYSYYPWVTVTSPMEGAMDAFPATVVATQTQVTVNWTASGAPWTQGYDISFYGIDFDGNPIAFDDNFDPVAATVVYNTFAAPISPSVLLNTNGDGTGVAYSATFALPASASGCTLAPIVTASADPAGALAAEWGGSNAGYGDAFFFAQDPVSLTTDLTVTAPAYGASVTVGGTLVVSWTGKNLLSTDKLTATVMNLDTSDTWDWTLPASFNPNTTFTYTLTLASATGGLASGYTGRADTAPEAIPQGVNFQVTLSAARPTFFFSGASSYFKVLAADAPVVTATLARANPAVASWGSALSLSYAISNFGKVPAGATLAVDLWLSVSGKHEPSSDKNITALARLPAAASGTLQLTIPADTKLAMVDSAFYFFALMVVEAPAAAAASDYLAIRAPSVTLAAPLTGVVAACGTTLTLAWSAFGIGPRGLAFDLYSQDATSGSDVFYASLGAGIDASLGTLAVALPEAMTRGSYSITAYNGATPATSTASASTTAAKFGITCRTRFNVSAFEPSSTVAAGDVLTVSYTVANLPLNAPLRVTLVNPQSGAVLQTLATDETYKGFVTLPTDPDTALSGVALRITDATDPTAFGTTPTTLTTVVPKQRLSLSTPVTWAAEKSVAVKVSASGFASGASITLDLVALTSQFTGPVTVQRLGSVAATAKTFSFKPFANMSTLPLYYIVGTEAASNFSARSEPATLTGGQDPPGVSVLRSGSTAPAGSAASRRLQATCAGARNLGPQSQWAAPFACAATCDACANVSGVWLVDVPISMTFNYSYWVGQESDKDMYSRQLGAFSTKDSLCWPAPNCDKTNLDQSTYNTPGAYTPCPGSANVDTSIFLGTVPWVQEAHAAQNTGVALTIDATVTVVAASAGAPDCASTAQASFDMAVTVSQDGAASSGSSGAGSRRVLQGSGDGAVTTGDVANTLTSGFAAAAPGVTSGNTTAAVGDDGAPKSSAVLPTNTAVQAVAPENRLYDVVIVGAGASGIAAAANALKRGLTVLMLEGRDRIGGRVYTDRSWTLPTPASSLRSNGPTGPQPVVPVDVGASWIHGVINNVLSTLVARFGIPYVEFPYGRNTVFFANGTRQSSKDSASYDAQWRTFMRSVKAWINETVKETDTSLQVAFDAVLAAGRASGAYSADHEMLFRYRLTSEIEHEWAADAADLSAWEWDNSGAINGGDTIFPLGFDAVLTNLFSADVASFAGNFTLLQGVRVTAVDTSAYASGAAPCVVTAQNTTSSLFTNYKGRSVIVTAPLGVLKAGSITFVPALPAPLASAITRLGMGLLNKYVVETVAPDSDNWSQWPTSDAKDEQFMFNRVGATPEDNVFTEFVNWQYVSRNGSMQTPPAGAMSRYAIGFASGKYALAQSTRSDYDVQFAVVSALGNMFPNITSANRFKRTAWELDPYALGSYSYNKVGSASADRLLFASGTGCAGLILAGEHANSVDFGTLHGALNNGYAAGSQIAPSAYTGAPAPGARRLAAHTDRHLSPRDWAARLEAHAPGSRELAAAAAARAAVLAAALAEGNTRHALNLARAASHLSRATLGLPEGDAASGATLEAWSTFTAPRIERLAGTPLPGVHAAAVYKSLVHMPDGRVLKLEALGSAHSGGLPEVGLDQPLAGFEHEGVFYADEAAHACVPGAGGVGHLCSIAGGQARYYASEREAAREVDVLRSEGLRAYLRAERLGARPDSLAWEAREHHAAQDARAARAAGGARALSNAAPTLTAIQAANPFTLNRMAPISGDANMRSAGFTGNRTTLLISVVWNDYVWNPATSPADPALTTISELFDGARDFTTIGKSTFGKLTPIVTASPCLYRLPLPFTTAYATNKATDPNSNTWMSAVRGAAQAAVTAAAGTAASVNGSTVICPALDPSTFHNFGIFQPGVPSENCAWGGIANWPGSLSLYNGKHSVDKNLHLLAHEIGHNYGFDHATVQPVCVSQTACPATSLIEYGDYVTTLGSGPVQAYGDYNLVQKHSAGWIEDAYVANLARTTPAWTGSTFPVPFYSSITLDLAAYDRVAETFDARDSLASLPPGTALAARAEVPPTWATTVKTKAGENYNRADPSYVYIGFMGANATWGRPAAPVKVQVSGVFDGSLVDRNAGPGIYLRSSSFGATTTGFTALTCFRDSSCSRQYPLEPNDALIYNPSGIALLVEARAFKPLPALVAASAAATPASPNSPTQDGVMTARLTYLDWQGRPVDGSAQQMYWPLYAAAAPQAAAAETLTLSLANGTAVFRIQPAAVTSYTVQGSCAGEAAQTARVGLSAFFGAFPTAHAFYGGNVGYSGELNFPPAGPIGPSNPPADGAAAPAPCAASFSFQAGPNAPVWVVAANYGAFKTTPSAVAVSLLVTPLASLAAAAPAYTVASTTQYQIVGLANTTATQNTDNYQLTYAAHTNTQGKAWTLARSPPGSCEGRVSPVPAGPSRIAGVTYASTCDDTKAVYTVKVNNFDYAAYCAIITQNGALLNGGACQWVFDGANQPTGNDAALGWVSEPMIYLTAEPQPLITCSAPLALAATPALTCGLTNSCPLGQVSDTGLALHCRCPLGWVYSAATGACSGAHLGGPLAVAPVLSSSRTFENWDSATCAKQTIAAFDGTLIVDCVPRPAYPIVQADCIDTTGQCLFYWDNSKKQYVLGVEGASAYARTVDPATHVVSWNGNAAIGAQLAPSAAKPDWTAYCALGAPTADWNGVRACYCGIGAGAVASSGGGPSICQACPAGTFKGIGDPIGAGTADAARNEACFPCPTGLLSPAGAEQCSAGCPAGTTASTVAGSQACLPSGAAPATPQLTISFRCADAAACANSVAAIASSSTATSGAGARLLLAARSLQAGGGGKKTAGKFTARAAKGRVSSGKSSGGGKGAPPKRAAGKRTLPLPKSGKGVSAKGVARSPAARASASKLKAINSAVSKAVKAVAFPSLAPSPSRVPTPSPKASPSRSVSPSSTPSRTPTPTPPAASASGASPSATPSSTPTPPAASASGVSPSATPSSTPTPPAASASGVSPSATPSSTPTPPAASANGASPSATPSSTLSASSTVSLSPTALLASPSNTASVSRSGSATLPPSPTATVTTAPPAKAEGSFTAVLPVTAFDGNTPTSATIGLLTTALSTSVAANGCASCAVAITKITHASTGVVLYTAPSSGAARSRALQGVGPINVAYSVSGGSAAAMAAVSAGAPSADFTRTLSNVLVVVLPGTTGVAVVSNAGGSGTSANTGTTTATPAVGAQTLGLGLGIGLGLGLPVLFMALYCCRRSRLTAAANEQGPKLTVREAERIAV